VHILADLNGALSGGNYAALPLAFIGGLVAGLNPCCLALYPAATNTCCSTSCKPVERPFASSLAFVLGLSLAVAALGSLAVYLGRVATVSAPLRYAIAMLPILMGVTQLGWLRLPFAAPVYASNTGVSNAFGTGFLLSLVIAPCATPILAGVLSYAAFSHNVGYGALLLFLFGLGTALSGRKLLRTISSASRDSHTRPRSSGVSRAPCTAASASSTRGDRRYWLHQNQPSPLPSRGRD
jgi:cytochrome c-type biogenesis protein